jgi:Carbamoyl-phosphate synthase L chain, ATP binding domain
MRRKVRIKLKPTVLVISTQRWLPTARLAVALADAGFSVESVCPAGHPISTTTAVKRTFRYRGLAPLESIAAAIAATTPDLLVSSDDLATQHLHRLHEQNSRSGKSGAAICSLIERSVGAPENFAIIDDRASFMQVSQQTGVRVPQTAAIADSNDLDQCAAQIGFPMVLKANGTWGGTGVRIVRNREEARSALHTLQAPPFFASAVKRAVFDRNTTLLRPSILRHQSAVNAQSFIDGTEATSAVACWKGEVLAGLHFEVLQKGHSEGPSTVLRRIAHPEMSATVEKMACRLQLSGLHGFDFMLERESRHAYLIEINPRITQVFHLRFGAGQDLPGALIAALLGTDVSPSPAVTENDVITLFPKEWLRDPSSPYLRSGYHDVPWDQPELVRSCIQKPGAQRLRRLTRRRRSRS